MKISVVLLLCIVLLVKGDYTGCDDAVKAPLDAGSGCCGKISHHYNSDVTKNPWTVELESPPVGGRKAKVHCKGTLISERYVLTAAHCLKHSLSYAKFGSTSQLCSHLPEGNQDRTTRQFCVPVQESFGHENYDSYSRKNDIAMIQLSYAVKYSNSVRPICLPTAYSEFETMILVTGRGSHTNAIQMTSRDRQWCQVSLQEISVRGETISDSQICATSSSGADAARGDSGGPLVAKVEGRYQLAGLVSYGPARRRHDKPGVYTRVYYYVDWIKLFQ